MRHHLSSVGRHAVAVAVLALEFAAIGMAANRNDELTIYLQYYIIIFFAFQAGLYRSLCGRADLRSFWIGFTAACAFVVMVQHWVETSYSPGVPGASVVASVLVAEARNAYYLHFQAPLSDAINARPRLSRFLFTPGVHFLGGALWHFVPQLLASVAGGVTVWFLGWAMGGSVGIERREGEPLGEPGRGVTMVTDVERQGRLGLWVSILGLALPVLLAMAFTALLERNVLRGPWVYYGLCLLLSGVLQLAALGCGLGALRSRSGKTGLLMSLAFLLLLGLAIASTWTVTVVQEGPDEQQAAPAARP